LVLCVLQPPLGAYGNARCSSLIHWKARSENVYVWFVGQRHPLTERYGL